MQSTVAVIRCGDYRAETVRAAVARGIECLGGGHHFFRPGETILLKPNLLAGDHPSRAVTTHPAIFSAVAEVFIAAGAVITYGDSPGKGNPERIARQAGIKESADRLGVRPADFRTAVKVSHPGALLAKQLHLAAGALEADGLVSLPKLKTHGFTRITGAVKNQFGCLPGLQKAEFHVKMPDIFDFSKVLVDINTYLKPRLYIMDGVTAMEGNGPRGGNPRDMKVILFSTDPVALDAAACRLIDLEPGHVPTMEPGLRAGLGTYLHQDITLVGDNIEPLIDRKFEAVRKPPNPFASARYFPPWLKNLLAPRPEIEAEACVKCGSCVLMCPVSPRALDWPEGGGGDIPVYQYKRCIRCYCCQEICPEKAITIKTPFLGRLIH